MCIFEDYQYLTLPLNTMRKLILLGLSLLFGFSAYAQFSVNENEAKTIAIKFIDSSQIKESTAEVLPFAIGTSKSPFSYVVNLYPEGWVLVAADKRVAPILAYSYTGTFVLQGLNDLPFYFWFKDYDRQIEHIQSSKTTSIHPEWNNKSFSSKVTVVEPLIEVNWNQNQGWNQFCPEDNAGPGGRVYAGCVAVAMGQAMSVYKHPNIGYGSKSYNSDYGLLTANFGETQYEWGKVHPTSANEHTALILYHLGISVSMGYGADGSGAYSRNVPGALKSYFDYSNEVTMLAKEEYSNDEWSQMLLNQLESGRPVYYSGNAGDNKAGHAFNLDGFDAGGRFHFNWGWSGAYNGYFVLTSLTPGNNIFTVNQQAVVNIYPRNHKPTDLFLSNKSIDEGLPAGTELATITVEDESPSDTHSFTVRGQENIFGYIPPVPFEVDNNKILTTSELSYKTQKSYQLVVEVEDSQGNKFDKLFEIKINEVVVETSAPLVSENNLKLSYSNGGISYSFSSNFMGKYSVLLTDISGKTIFNESFHKLESYEQNFTHCRNARPGIYVFSIIYENTFISKKIYLY
jgi:hypothetical protein